ncbi:MAG: metalloregulator ArsR/SmtB family transcription factor [Burkholderiaceae bacterium]
MSTEKPKEAMNATSRPAIARAGAQAVPEPRVTALSELSELPGSNARDGVNGSDSAELDQVFELVSRYFALLSDPTRLRILRSICASEKSVNDIVSETGTSQANVSRQLRTLHDAGVLTRRKDRNFAFYQVSDSNLIEICRMAITDLIASAPLASDKRDRARALASHFASAGNHSDKPN